MYDKIKVILNNKIRQDLNFVYFVVGCLVAKSETRLK